MWWHRHILAVAAFVSLVRGTDRDVATNTGAVNRTVSCEDARLKCAYRKGCGMALQNYMLSCMGELRDSDRCPENCQHALIALTSSDEGKELMNCECTDDFCADSKRHVEICRPQVLKATNKETVVSCRIAEWICSADALCSTALEYYNRYCKSMFHGRKCTNRCNNSISILRRQEKAAKLNSCKCDGFEEYDCPKIQKNMARLCFHKDYTDEETNEVVMTELSERGPTAGVATLLTRRSHLLWWSFVVTAIASRFYSAVT